MDTDAHMHKRRRTASRCIYADIDTHHTHAHTHAHAHEGRPALNQSSMSASGKGPCSVPSSSMYTHDPALPCKRTELFWQRKGNPLTISTTNTITSHCHQQCAKNISVPPPWARQQAQGQERARARLQAPPPPLSAWQGRSTDGSATR